MLACTPHAMKDKGDDWQCHKPIPWSIP